MARRLRTLTMIQMQQKYRVSIRTCQLYVQALLEIWSSSDYSWNPIYNSHFAANFPLSLSSWDSNFSLRHPRKMLMLLIVTPCSLLCPPPFPGGGKNITDLGDSSATTAAASSNGRPSDLLSSALNSSGVPGGSGVKAEPGASSAANPRQSKIERFLREGLLTKDPGGGQAGYQVIKAEQPQMQGISGGMLQQSEYRTGPGVERGRMCVRRGGGG